MGFGLVMKFTKRLLDEFLLVGLQNYIRAQASEEGV